MHASRLWAGVVTAAAVALTSCSGSAGTTDAEPLRDGERIVEIALPETYSPEPPFGGTDDYRCFLLDPELEEDAFVTGIDVVPEAPQVHHVILFRLPPEQVSAAQAADDAAPGQGWTCFGGSGLDSSNTSLENAPWLGAWAPGGSEQVMADDLGIPIEAGSRIVMQVHYNLLQGASEDRSAARLRLAPGTKDLAALETMLLPAPVELPCRPGKDGPLCERENALRDLADRFGPTSAATPSGLRMFCGGAVPGPTQSCSWWVDEATTVRGVAGHMHLLGRSITIEVNPDGPDARTLLDIPVWNFDDQGTEELAEPAVLEPGDELRVTCTHDQGMRDLLPALERERERYVLWGDGSTDEMCLGLALVTRP